MALNANSFTSYELSNYESTLGNLIAEVDEEMNKLKGGAAKFRSDLLTSIRSNNFVGAHQVTKPEPGRQMTIGELCQSYKHEVTQQVIDPLAIRKILFGPDGLVRKAGGGRAPYLMEDIEVGFIYDPIAGTSVGPVITSGRNRTIALQIMLRGAGLSPEAINNLKVRVSVIQVSTPEELQRRIISANTGSRDFSRAEIRERMGSAGGIQLVDRSTIEQTIVMARNERNFKAAMGAWLKDAAHSNGLNTFTPAQYSDAGNSLWTSLAKKNRPSGKTFYSWVKNDVRNFIDIARAAESALPSAVELARRNNASGPASGKLTSALLPAVATACRLVY
jgi:hypothetical protein